MKSVQVAIADIGRGFCVTDSESTARVRRVVSCLNWARAVSVPYGIRPMKPLEALLLRVLLDVVGRCSMEQRVRFNGKIRSGPYFT